MTKWFLNFDFGGRARRSHYWANLGAWFAVIIGLAIAIASATPKDASDHFDFARGGISMVLAILIFLSFAASAIDNIAMVFRRAHDTGKSGWVWLLLLIPVINLLPFYWLMIQDSDQGPNKYGPPVKAFYQPSAPAV
jgi:uncharacterized membrane protein YhaH (DUF805 family)